MDFCAVIYISFAYFFFQAIFFLLVRPFSKRVYRIINIYVTEMLWLEVIWLADWWANVKVLASLYQIVIGIILQT